MQVNGKEIKRIAVFTSGGDAPGMNAALRAVVRTASYYDLHVYGIMRGYEGMIDGDFVLMEKRDVGNIMHRGGTILKTARSERFRTKEGRQSAYESLLAYNIDACIAIGGNGTFTGAHVFSSEFGVPFIGIPGTIDNDLYGTDLTIGFDTAVNTAIEAADKIRDTAESHNRLFFIEVMGRNSGLIALNTAIGVGAGLALIPEKETSIDELVQLLKITAKRKKLFNLIVVAEGNKTGNAQQVAQQVRERIDLFDIRVTVIGHMQRGGSPTFQDRVLASRLGQAAVEGLLQGQRNVMVGWVDNKISFTPLKEAISTHKKPGEQLLRIAEMLAI